MAEWVKDNIQSGLYKRTREDGHVWAVKGRIRGGSVVTITIGKTEHFPITKARNLTKTILSQLAEGINTNLLKQQQTHIKAMRGLTLQQALNDYSSIVQWKTSTR